MKKFLLLGWTVIAPLATAGSPAWAAACSRGADCNACSNCSGCGWCARSGGTCSVCRPDLYRAVSAPQRPVYSPPSTYNPAQTRRRTVTPRAPRRQRQSSRSITVPGTWTGRVVGVADGDTLTVLYGQSPIRIRLFGIDAPEKSQPFGQQSKNHLSRLAFGKTATINSKGADRYGRVLAWVFVGYTGVNLEQVKAGMAWWYRQYSPGESALSVLETKARAARRGLWSQASPVAPWDYRRRR